MPDVFLWAAAVLAFVALALWADIRTVDYLTRAHDQVEELCATTTTDPSATGQPKWRT